VDTRTWYAPGTATGPCVPPPHSTIPLNRCAAAERRFQVTTFSPALTSIESCGSTGLVDQVCTTESRASRIATVTTESGFVLK
jgi:hypothetical protein